MVPAHVFTALTDHHLLLPALAVAPRTLSACVIGRAAKQLHMAARVPNEPLSVPGHNGTLNRSGFSGDQFGELATLQPRDLDLGRRRVTITRSLAEVRGVITETEPKTSASKRSITLPQAVADDLGAHLDHHATGRTDRVFTAPQGGPLRRRSFRNWFWLPAVAASVGQPVRFHDLRHTHAALLIAANTHPKLLQSQLGHTSIKTTSDIYGHLYEPLDEVAADRLEQLIADAIAHRTRAERGLEL
jgi:integrase